MATFQGKRVSTTWWYILTEYERQGGRLRLNSGKRTIPEQWVLYNNYRRTGWPIAAYPNPNAPHIRVGRVDHALDVDTNVGHGEAGFQRWLEKNGVRMHNPVRGEAWHMEAISAAELKAFAARIKRKRNVKRRRLAALRKRAASVRAAIRARAKKGLKSPGQTKLLKRLNAQISEAPMKASKNAIQLIAAFEGFRSRPYKIGNDPWTIGYGETQGIGPRSGPWTEPYARYRLKQRVNRDFAPAVDRFRRKHNLNWTQNQFDALVSFAYNLGTGMFVDGSGSGQSIRGALKTRKTEPVVNALLLYVMPGSQFEKGLRRRREAEGRLFAKGDNSARLARLRKELKHRRAQLLKLRKQGKTNSYLIRRINELVAAIRKIR